MLRCFTVSAILAGVALAQVNVPKGDLIPHHSLMEPFVHDWWEEGIPHWDIGGDAVATHEMVRLTPDRASKFGWLWNSQINDNPWWEARVRFFVRSRGKNPGADGMALWYVEKPTKEEKAGPVHGMPPDFRGLGIIFDTYDNDRMRNNPAVSILDNSKGKKEKWDTEADYMNSASAQCQFDFRNSPANDPIEATLSYYQNTLSLKLRRTNGAEVHCGEVKDIELPMGWTFGLTASTGGLSDNHDVVAFELRPLGDPIGDPNIPQEAAKKRTPQPKQFDHHEDSKQKDYWKANPEEAEKTN